MVSISFCCSSSHHFCLYHEAQWNSHRGFHPLLLTTLFTESTWILAKSFANEPRKKNILPTLFYEKLRTILTGALPIRSKDMVKKGVFFLNVYLKSWTKSTWVQRVSQSGNKHVWNKYTILLPLVVPKWEKNLNNVNVGKKNSEEKFLSNLNEKFNRSWAFNCFLFLSI